jgi:putative ABC transport system permease protein
MGRLRRFVLRLYNALRPGGGEADLDREVRAHLGLLEDELVRRGLTREEARRAARQSLGGVDQAKELHRDARSFAWLDDARRNLAYAVRTLRRSPGYAAAIVLILAVGIGANSAMFTVLDGVVLKPLGYPDPDRIVGVMNRWTDTGKLIANLAGGDEIDIRAQPGTFEAFAYHYGGEMGVQLKDHAEFVGTRLVHPDFFRVFGLAPAAGRTFQAEDAERSAVVSLGFAFRNFGGAAAAIGQTVSLDERPYEIVGVMPAGLRFPARTDVWLAAALEPSNRNRSGHNYRVVAKLAPGVTVEGANAKLSALAAELARAFPDSNAHKSFEVVPLRDLLVGAVRPMLFVLMAAVVLVLLIACANVANLMLAHAAGRAREVAVRTAIGAARRHIIGQLLAESLVLAFAAGALGVVVARVGVPALLHASSRYVPLPRLEDVQTDWRVLLFTVAVSVLTAIGFGLLPALQVSRVNVSEALQQGGARGGLGGGHSRTRNVLLVAQIALSFALAVDAGLLVRSFQALGAAALGYRTEGILVTYAHAPARGSLLAQVGLDDYLRVGAQLDDLVERIRALPGVIAAGAAMGLPTGQYNSDGSYAVEGKHEFEGDFRRLPYAGFRLAGPGYFGTMGIPVVRGREFDAGDVYDRPFVVIVSQALVRQTFPNEDPIGHRIKCGFDAADKWMTIVGVVGDVRQESPAAPPAPELYMPLRQHPYAANEVQIVARTSGSAEALVPSVRQAVREMGPEVATRFTTMEASVNDSVAAPRFRMTLVGTFAALALLLAVAGMYAVMSYVIAQRRSEFGLRIALGARMGDVVALVLRGAGRLAAIGAAIGLVLALATSRLMTAMVFGIQPADAVTYAAILLLALPVVVLAALVPAVRAARVDPGLSLRE